MNRKYTKQSFGSVKSQIIARLDLWEILDPDGDWICTVCGEDNADALLSHLNRK